jgi:hypothetical protein
VIRHFATASIYEKPAFLHSNHTSNHTRDAGRDQHQFDDNIHAGANFVYSRIADRNALSLLNIINERNNFSIRCLQGT